MSKRTGNIGIYTAHGRLTLAMFKGKDFKSVSVDIPENIVSRGEILSKNLYATFIRDTIKANGFRAKNASFVIGADQVFIRNVKIPKMADEQIKYNLPFEFRDYIRGELKDYLYDYAYRPPMVEKNTEGDEQTLDLLAVAVPVEYFDNVSEIVQKAGLKLVKALPEVCVLERLLKEFPTPEEQKIERCFLDIGNSATRLQIFKDGKYKLAQLIDIGINHVRGAIADDMNIDFELAKTYLKTKYENCDRSEAAMNAYRDISAEIIKGFNYYEMSDMSSRLNEVVIYGNGGMIEPLVELLKERISMHVITMNEAFPQFNKDGMFNVMAASTGVLLDN